MWRVSGWFPLQPSLLPSALLIDHRILATLLYEQLPKLANASKLNFALLQESA
jgi:hypothetical protein